MKLYSIFSPSHKYLYENYFLKTVPKEFELDITQDTEQLCSSGEYYSRGWNLACRKKVDIFIRACEENIGNEFLYCDVDVQFFGDIKSQLLNELGDYDIACQDDSAGIYNSGFFICRANKNSLHLFHTMKNLYRSADNCDDQTSLNEHIHLCKSKLLSHRFFSVGQIFHRRWLGEDFNLPQNILTHHANWVEGLQNKSLLLDFVRQKFNVANHSFSPYYTTDQPSHQ